ncbi:MAG: molybdopterin-dependent oxidoreductase, partial [Chloroflexota bacterium]|nr:molybdopterin-dependent oxidoreductase [Chloroflexota bacterium]
MSVNKDIFERRRDSNYDFQSVGAPATGWEGADDLPDALVPTHCCFCGCQCGMYLRVASGQVTGVEPRAFPHNRGSLCPKGIVAYQQVNHPDRLTYPMMRRGGKNGRLERATWDEALDYVARRWREIQEQHGRDAVSVYSGSSMTNEKCYLMGKFARVGLGTRHIDYNGRLCMSSAGVAYAKAFGIDRAPLPMTDVVLSDCMLVVGSNVAECFPIMMQWLWRARDNGAKLIVMDPRETPTARTADLWLPVRPGTDVAVLNAMLRVIIHDGLVDEAYVRESTVG